MEDTHASQAELFGGMLVAERPSESRWNGGITYGDFVRALYARAHAMQAGPHGLSSAKSKTGDPKCSAAVSAWVRHKATAETHKQLAQCRAAARAGGQAQKQRAAGNEAKAQHLEHRVESGEPLTKKDRSAKAKELLAERSAKRRPEKVSAATEAPDSGEGSGQPARQTPRVFKKPAPKSPEQAKARDAVEAALQAKERVNRAIQDYGMGSPDEISATRAYKTARLEASAAMKAAGNKPRAKKLARYPGLPGESEGLRADAAPPEKTAESDERHKKMFDEFQALGQEYRKNQWSNPQVAARAHERAKALIAEGKKLGFDLTQGDPSKVPAGSATQDTEDRKDLEEGRRIGLEGDELAAYVRSKQGKGQIHDVIQKTQPKSEDKPKGSPGFFSNERSKTESLTGRVGVPREKEVPEDMRRGAEEIAKKKEEQAKPKAEEPKGGEEGSKKDPISRLESAFEEEDKKDRGKNFVSLHRLKPYFPEMSMEEFHSLVNKARKEHGYAGDSHEGHSGGLTPEMKAASIREREGNMPITYLSRREGSTQKKEGGSSPVETVSEKAKESSESKPEHHKHVEEAKQHVFGKLLNTFVEHGGLSEAEAEKMKAEAKAESAPADQPSAARQRTAARLAEQKAKPSEPKKEAAKTEEPKKKLTVKSPAKAPEKPTPFPTEGPFARSPSRGDRPKSVQSPSRPNTQTSKDDAEKTAEGNRRQEEERAAWERRNPPKLTPEQEKARKAEGRKAGDEMRKRHEAEYAADQAKRDEEFRRNEEKHNPQPAKSEPSGYDEHGRERAIVKAIQKVHGDEPVDDRGMMIERIARESGLPHDEAWKTMLEMADRGALEFDPLEEREAELSKQYGAKTYQPHHLRGKHANVVRLMRPGKLNVPLEKSGRSQYAMARDTLRRYIA